MANQTITFPGVHRPAVEIRIPDSGGNRFRIPEREIPETTSVFDPDLAGESIRAARRAAESAYAPYSGFRVGAAVVMRDDPEVRVFSGCNIENASYGATVCAERNAIFKAAAEGLRRISFLAVSTIDTLDSPLSGRSPCGVCRQVLREFAGEDTLILIDSGNAGIQGEVLNMERLLPYGFSLNAETG